MTDRWTDSLSEYLDGDLTPEDRRELALHLESCADCALTLRELEQVTERARALPDLTPPKDGWPALLARLVARELPIESTEIQAPPPARRAQRGPTRVVSFTWPQLAAAGIAVAILLSVAFWMGWRDNRRVASAPSTLTQEHAETVSDTRDTEHAIAELKEALAGGREDLDPETVRVLEQNLSTIERSIREAKSALDSDPGNPYLKRHLQETMTRKVTLIRQATFLASTP